MKTVQLMRAICAALFIAAVSFGCKKETEELTTEPLADYIPTQPGKYIVYQLDSTLFTNFGTSTVVRSYQEKHQVDAAYMDNEGRTAYRVFRWLRKADGTGPWAPAGTFSIVPGNKTVEVVENNLRFLKLAAPLRTEFSWKGNRYLPDEPYSASFAFNNDNVMGDWDYTYTGTGETLTLNGKTVNDVITVEHINESVNAPVTIPGAYGFINYSVNQFAKGIGLVYEELTMWEYQPNPGGNSGFRTGFGVKRSMIEHN
ncbi:MAG: hypothetical protein M3Q06_06110 [Bacteroidota bacterium]|nr:hypothetical protein [Bacteroidota bacterium]